VRARAVLRCTEGFTARLPGMHRALLPMNSSMVVTEPLDDAAWKEIGWAGGETLSDEAHAYMYAQRTADGRIAIGGRGVPYRFGSAVDDRGETSPATAEALRALIRRLFPAAASAKLDHAWSGVLGVPRDWCAAVNFAAAAGLGWAGGYSGHGVLAANLAGRTLSDLVAGEPTELTALPLGGLPQPRVGARASPLGRGARPVRAVTGRPIAWRGTPNQRARPRSPAASAGSGTSSPASRTRKAYFLPNAPVVPVCAYPHSAVCAATGRTGFR